MFKREHGKMVRSARIERATDCLEGSCSIQLSYERNARESGGPESPVP
jgi:hypothetical protein